MLDNHYFHDMFAHSTEVPKDQLPLYWSAVGRLKRQFIDILRQFYPKSKKMCYIFTSVLLKGEKLPKDLEQFADDVQADFIPIQLVAQNKILINRCQTKDRQLRKKISSSTSMTNFLAEHKDEFPDYDHPNKLCIDVSSLTEEDTFSEIQKHLAKFDSDASNQLHRSLGKER